MLRHVVLMNWTEAATGEQVAEIARRLRELPAAIPEIRSYQCGDDLGVNPGNANFVVTADFDSVDDYIVYRDHPAHRKVIDELIAPILASRTGAQFSLDG
ncbi:stress protein [Spongiactinospora gelatinilytica]|uniref:Stress protein n=1 Tax=Spongiactinospora gelatinilytica TaxID=2666298 RepID=A0A2W2F661_9ACTN|nr:Dabb family protein [Spongiactinospora gelatinilytica]PZG20568.1 stress protein [Spongiactinospora gelatinilytica]